MYATCEDIEKVKKILMEMYLMSLKEDWDDGNAQALILDGGALYLELINKKGIE